MANTTPRRSPHEALAAALEAKVATHAGDDDAVGRALDRLRIILDAVLVDQVAQNLMEDGNKPEPLGRRDT